MYDVRSVEICESALDVSAGAPCARGGKVRPRFSSRVLPDRFAGQSSRVPRISYHGDLKNEADKGGVDALLGYIKENVPGY
jgi:hypothetical protein